jgi:hypothetical protein
MILRERYYAISQPLEYRHSRLMKDKKYALYLFMFCFFISIPFYLYTKLVESVLLIGDETHLQKRCDKSPDSEIFLTLIDSIFYCFIPFLITLMFSFLTLVKLFQVKKSQKITGKRSQKKLNMSSARALITLKMNKQKILDCKNEIPNSKALTLKKSLSLGYLEPEFMVKRYLDKRRSLPIIFYQLMSNSVRPTSFRRNKFGDFELRSSCKNYKFRITFMLMIFPISFLLTTLPIFIIIGLRTFNFYFKLNLEIPFTLAKIFMYLNNSINIFILIIFGKTLRKDFLKTFCMNRIKQNHNQQIQIRKFLLLLKNQN